MHLKVVIFGFANKFQTDPRGNLDSIETTADGCLIVRGTPVSRGVFKGTARVVTRLADAKTIQRV
jgi:hypothetical protein